MEDYKEKYEMALEKAKKLLSKCKCDRDRTTMIYRAEDIESIFPELKEFSDKEIKEWLIGYFQQYKSDGIEAFANGLKIDSIIAWLEKQGQSKKTSIWKHWKDGIAGNEKGKSIFLIKNGSLYSLSSCLSFECDYIELSELDNLMLEKQDNLTDIANKEYWRGYKEGKQEAFDKYSELEKQSVQNINILWHDVSEEPEEQRELFCKWKGSNIDAVWHDVAFYHADTKTFWNGKHQIENVIKWTYVDEILNKSNPYSGVSFKFNGHTWGMCARDNGVEILIDGEIKERVFLDNETNKVEPKFHEGDWVATGNGDTLQIQTVKNGYYILCNGMNFDMSYVDKYWHLWTIEDAKDGDVLWHSDSASNGIFIFKEIKHDGKVLCYCDYDSEDHFCLGEHHTCCWINDKYIKPATKEQRYLLFKKMKEAGYKWNVDEKELIKL